MSFVKHRTHDWDACSNTCLDLALTVYLRCRVGDGREVFENAVLVTSLDDEILSLGQLYRDRADCEIGQS
jgi:hypothetical protein